MNFSIKQWELFLRKIKTSYTSCRTMTDQTISNYLPHL